MSYQSSIYFDPTALLIVKKEIDQIINQVENTVSELIEDQTLPFGIDDAFIRLEQSNQVFAMIELPHLAQLAHYCAQVMSKMMQNPTAKNLKYAAALSDGTTMLKRYIEFICLREVDVPQFLLDTLNHLERVLNIPCTALGNGIQTTQKQLTLTPQASSNQINSSDYWNTLYKDCLIKLVTQNETEDDFDRFKLIVDHIALLSLETPSQQYWLLMQIAFNQLDQLILSDARLKWLAKVGSQIREFLNAPQHFQVDETDFANALAICISQENYDSQMLREYFQISDNILTDVQLQIFSRHLFGPDQRTIDTVAHLITEELNQLRLDIESHYQSFTDDQILDIRLKLYRMANIFLVMNLNEAYAEMKLQAEHFHRTYIQQNADFAQRLMNSMLSAMNSIGILKRNFAPTRIQLDVNNMNISLDRLDDAHETLQKEARILLQELGDKLFQNNDAQDTNDLLNITTNLRQLSGAALFLDAQVLSNALKNSAEAVEHYYDIQKSLTHEQLQHILDVLASLELHLDGLKYDYPIHKSVSETALISSQKIKAVA
ncbi:chemotaxis protein [Acinetobacter sp. YH16032]|uniref:chemotaxis protein n=1 Tax=Acinetobacter sp. YH16032 TaxID=2601181 RepID=UPI0015D2337D|nr:chemotaxis protein [Acinetobacter sp. YH16032]